jgi:3',5'-cyclic AMP phosphodiesterase CpdA
MSQTTASTSGKTPSAAWSTSGGPDAPYSAGESAGAPAPTVLRSAASIVYLSYTLETLPPKPPGSWTRFVCVSDTHTRAFAVPPGDVLLHGGDLTHVGRLAEFRTTVGWLSSLPHPQKM